MTAQLVEAIDLAKTYRGRRKLFRPRTEVRAVDGVSFSIAAGEALGLVGESGCGKTTVGRMVSATISPSGGAVMVDGAPFVEPLPLARRAIVQVVFQDALGALNPRLPIARQLEEPLVIHGVADRPERERRILAALASTRLSPGIRSRFPMEVSGGQRQRVLLARSLVLRPRFLVCDEPVSALDVSVQAEIVNLLADLKQEQALALLFISHDLRVVRHLCDRIAVMYLGRLIETGPSGAVLRDPAHPYTRALVGSIAIATPSLRGRKRMRLAGEPPSASSPPAGCAFHPRCPHARDVCREARPPLQPRSGDRLVACHRADEIGNG